MPYTTKRSLTVVDGEILSERLDASGTISDRDYVPDSLGSTVRLVDGTGTMTDTYDYWPFGELRSHTGTYSTPFLFVGTKGYYNDTADRTYVRARHYRQDLGRWMSVDPLWPEERPYEYTRNNPTTLVDISGLHTPPAPSKACRCLNCSPTKPTTTAVPLYGESTTKDGGRVTLKIDAKGTIKIGGQIIEVGLELGGSTEITCNQFTTTTKMTKIKGFWTCKCDRECCSMCNPKNPPPQPKCTWHLTKVIKCKGQQVRRYLDCPTIGRVIELSNVFHPYYDQSKECREGDNSGNRPRRYKP